MKRITSLIPAYNEEAVLPAYFVRAKSQKTIESEQELTDEKND